MEIRHNDLLQQGTVDAVWNFAYTDANQVETRTTPTVFPGAGAVSADGSGRLCRRPESLRLCVQRSDKQIDPLGTEGMGCWNDGTECGSRDSAEDAAEDAVASVAAVASTTERVSLGASAAAAGTVAVGPPKTVPVALAGKMVADKVASKAGVVGTLADGAKAAIQLADGKPRDAAKTGLQITERLVGAAIGAEVLGPPGALIGTFAPEALDGVNDAIVNSHPIEAAEDATGTAMDTIREFIHQMEPLRGIP